MYMLSKLRKISIGPITICVVVIVLVLIQLLSENKLSANYIFDDSNAITTNHISSVNFSLNVFNVSVNSNAITNHDSFDSIKYCDNSRVLYLIEGSNIELSPIWYNQLFNNSELNNDAVYLLYNKSNEYLINKYNSNPEYKQLTMIPGYNTTWTTGRNLLHAYALSNQYNLTLKSLGKSCRYKYFSFLDEDLILVTMVRGHGDYDMVTLNDSYDILLSFYNILDHYEPAIAVPFVSNYLKYKQQIRIDETQIGIATGFDPMALWIHSEYFTNKLLLPYNTSYDQTWTISGAIFQVYNTLLIPNGKMITYERLYLYNDAHRKYDKSIYNQKQVLLAVINDILQPESQRKYFANIDDYDNFKLCFGDINMNNMNNNNIMKYFNQYPQKVKWIKKENLTLKGNMNYSNLMLFESNVYSLCPDNYIHKISTKQSVDSIEAMESIETKESIECKYKFTIFNMSKIIKLFPDYAFANYMNCGAYNKYAVFAKLYQHKCFTSNIDEAVILISSLGYQPLKKHPMNTNIACMSPKPRQNIFESTFIKPWVKYVENELKGTKYLFFITYVDSRYNSDNNTNIPFNVGRISVDSYKYFYRDRIDISFPSITLRSFLNETYIQMKKYLIVFRGTARNYAKQFVDERYNKQPNIRMHHLRERIDYIIHHNMSLLNDSIKYTVYYGPKYKFQFFQSRPKYSNTINTNSNARDDMYKYEILNSHFCFQISGDGLWSYRFMESLSAGCIPVIVSNGWVLPFADIINWDNYILSINESMFYLPSKIKNSNDLIHYLCNSNQTKFLLQNRYHNDLSNWHQAIINLYRTYFANDVLITNNLIQSMYIKIDREPMIQMPQRIIFLSPLHLNWTSKLAQNRKEGICKIMFVNYKMNVLQKTIYFSKVNDYSKYAKYGKTFIKMISFYQKLLEINDTYNMMEKNKLIIMMYDAFDVYFQVNYDQFLSKYLQLISSNTQTDSIIINTELNCHVTWLKQFEEEAACNKMKIDSLSNNATQLQQPAYINTGVFIGKFNVLLDVFDQLFNNFLPIFIENYKHKDVQQIDDQALFIMYYTYLHDKNLNYNIISPDYESNLIQTFHLQRMNYKKKKIPLPFEMRNVSNHSVLYNINTHLMPSVLHFNGHAKDLMIQYIDQKIAEYEDWNTIDFEYHTDLGDFRWKDLCIK